MKHDIQEIVDYQRDVRSERPSRLIWLQVHHQTFIHIRNDTYLQVSWFDVPAFEEAFQDVLRARARRRENRDRSLQRSYLYSILGRLQDAMSKQIKCLSDKQRHPP